MLSYCVKERKQTERVEPSGYKTAKNGRKMFWCTCASCGIKKYRFVKSDGSTTSSKKTVKRATTTRKRKSKKSN